MLVYYLFVGYCAFSLTYTVVRVWCPRLVVTP